MPPRPGLPGLPPHDPYLDASRRYAAQAAGAAGLPSPYGRKCQILTETNDIHDKNVLVGDRLAAERMAAERLALGSLATDPLVRLQMAGINPEVIVLTQFN